MFQDGRAHVQLPLAVLYVEHLLQLQATVSERIVAVRCVLEVDHVVALRSERQRRVEGQVGGAVFHEGLALVVLRAIVEHAAQIAVLRDLEAQLFLELLVATDLWESRGRRRVEREENGLVLEKNFLLEINRVPLGEIHGPRKDAYLLHLEESNFAWFFLWRHPTVRFRINGH